MARTVTVEIKGDASQLHATLDDVEKRIAEFEQRLSHFDETLARYTETVERLQ